MNKSLAITGELRIAFLGNKGFPYRIGAEISRLLLLAKGLSENRCKVLVIIRKGYKTFQDIPAMGMVEGVRYQYATGRVGRPENLFLRAWDIAKGAVKEIMLLKQNRIQVVIINSRSFWLVLNYWFWGKLIGYKMLLNYVEYSSQLRGRKRNILKRTNDILYEKYVFKLINGVLPISELLTRVAHKSNPHLPYVKVPVLVDFSKFEADRNPSGGYYVFCSHATYYYLFEFVIRSFELIDDHQIRLKLVVYGKQEDMSNLQGLIKGTFKSTLIDVLTGIAYEDLVSCYVNAIGLLIPLKPILKDEARFPHKIGEYAAAGRPIITTRFGEIENYFFDGVNALIAEKYDCQLFAQKMKFAFNHPEQGDSIGKNAQLTGRKYFDYKLNGEKIRQLIDQIVPSASS